MPFWHMDAAMASLLILQTAVDDGPRRLLLRRPAGAGRASARSSASPTRYDPVGVITLGHRADADRRRRARRRAGRARPVDDVVHRGQLGHDRPVSPSAERSVRLRPGRRPASLAGSGIRDDVPAWRPMAEREPTDRPPEDAEEPGGEPGRGRAADRAAADLGRPADPAGDGARRLRRPARRGQADQGPRRASTTRTGGSRS